MTDEIATLLAKQGELKDRVNVARKALIGMRIELTSVNRALRPYHNALGLAAAEAEKERQRKSRYDAMIALYGDGGERSFDDLVNLICVNYELNRETLFGARRRRQYVETRCYLMWLLRLRGLGFKRIGNMFGKRHHAAAIHCCYTFNDLIEHDTTCRELLRSYKIVRFTDDF